MSDDNTEITSTPNGKITYKKGKGTDHTCIKVEEIQEIHDVVLGPDGLVSQVTMITNKQEVFSTILDKIDKNMDGVVIDMAERKGAREGRKALEEKIKIKEALEATKKRDYYWRVATVIGIFFTALGLYFAYFSPTHKKLVKIEAVVETTKDTIVTVIRGERYIPDALKMDNDTTKEPNK